MSNTLVSGLIPLNKPKGMSSRQASTKLARSLFGKSVKFGHVGTLDPCAYGVLPVLFGHATKCMDYLHSNIKEYEFNLKIGQLTTTLDAEGDLVETVEAPRVTESRLIELEKEFCGEMEQVPPLYSAIKFNGKPLYEYARSGRGHLIDMQQFKRKIEIYKLELVGQLSELESRWRVRCSKGTYVRVIAFDLARALGTIGYVTDLCRTESSGFRIEDSLRWDETSFEQLDISSHLKPIAELPFVFPSWKSSESLVKRLLWGQEVAVSRSEFSEGLQGQINQELAETSLLLLDPEDQAFAIGKCQNLMGDRIKIRISRGLK